VEVAAALVLHASQKMLPVHRIGRLRIGRIRRLVMEAATIGEILEMGEQGRAAGQAAPTSEYPQRIAAERRRRALLGAIFVFYSTTGAVSL
jgi:hypothetical protein